MKKIDGEVSALHLIPCDSCGELYMIGIDYDRYECDECDDNDEDIGDMYEGVRVW